MKPSYFYYRNFIEILDVKFIFASVSYKMKIFVLNFIRISIIIFVVRDAVVISVICFCASILHRYAKHYKTIWGNTLQSKEGYCLSKMGLLFNITVYKMCIDLFNDFEIAMSTTNLLLSAPACIVYMSFLCIPNVQINTAFKITNLCINGLHPSIAGGE